MIDVERPLYGYRPFGGALDLLTASRDQAPQVRREHGPLHDDTERPEWSRKPEPVPHERAACRRLEDVVVGKGPKRAAHHDIAKLVRPVERLDPSAEPLTDANVPPLELDLIAEPKKSVVWT